MKIKFLVDVPDKYTKENYKKGQVKEFEDKRAKEILMARQGNGQPYAEEVVEIETAVKEVKTEKAVKKVTKKPATKKVKSIELDLNNGTVKEIEE